MAQFDIAFIGSGYSVAAYLAFVDLPAKADVLIIGMESPWKVNSDYDYDYDYNYGRGGGDINHSVSTYSLIHKVRTRPPKENWVSNRSVLQDPILAFLKWRIPNLDTQTLPRAGFQVSDVNERTYHIILKSVSKVRKAASAPTDEFPFKIDLTGTQDATYSAKKIVYGGGAGPHRFPSEFFENSEKNPDAEHIIDIDNFMRQYGSDTASNNKDVPSGKGLANKNIALFGPNAGIDALIAILNSGGTPYWFMKETDKPFWLSSMHYKATVSKVVYKQMTGIEVADETVTLEGEELVEFCNNAIFRYKDTKPPIVNSVEGGAKKINIIGTFGDKKVPENHFTYLVYAMGQDPAKESGFGGGPLMVLDPGIVNDLEPIPDANLRYSNVPGQIVVGLRIKETTRSLDKSKLMGLEVIGASAFAIVNALARGDATGNFGTFAKTAKDIQGKMMALPKLLNQQTLVAADQLGVIRAQLEMLTGYDPRPGYSKELTDLINAMANIRIYVNNIRTCAANEVQTLPKPPYGEIQTLAALAQGPKSIRQGLTDAVIAKVPEGLRPRFTPLIANENRRRKRLKIPTLFDNPMQWEKDLTEILKLLYKLARTTNDYKPYIDFNGADRTQMSVDIHAFSPFIEDHYAEKIVNDVIHWRAAFPRGFNKEQLDALNELVAIAVIGGQPKAKL